MPVTRAQREAARREAARGQPRASTPRRSPSGSPVYCRRIVRNFSPSPSPPPSVKRGRDRSPLRGRARRAYPSPPPAGRARASPPQRRDRSHGGYRRHGSPGRGSLLFAFFILGLRHLVSAISSCRFKTQQENLGS